MSESLLKLKKSIVCVTLKKDIPPKQVNHAQLSQVLWGTLYNDHLLNLRLRERLENPPTFLALLKEVREQKESEGGFCWLLYHSPRQMHPKVMKRQHTVLL